MVVFIFGSDGKMLLDLDLSYGEIDRAGLEKILRVLSSVRSTMNIYDKNNSVSEEELEDWIELVYEDIAEKYGAVGTNLKGGRPIAIALESAYQFGKKEGIRQSGENEKPK